MADGTKIEWTDSTWNVVNGCSVVSPGCTNCYAMRLAGTRLQHHPSRAGLTIDSKAGPVWTGEVRFNDKVLLDPLRWRRPRKIFVCAHGDLFHENVPDEWIDRVFAVMALAPQHIFQVLTKRPERMREYLASPAAFNRLADATADLGSDKCVEPPERFVLPLPNVWLGVSVEDQKRADERIPVLLDTAAAVRWLSCEPLLGPVDLGLNRGWCKACRQLTDGSIDGHCMDLSSPCFEGEVWRSTMLDWIVVGGESGQGARPMHPTWARSLRDQCAAAGVPFHFKQWGDWRAAGRPLGPVARVSRVAVDAVVYEADRLQCFPDGQALVRVGKKAAGRLLDGVQHDGYPA